MLYLGIRGKYEDLPHHTIHIASDYSKNLRQIEDQFVLPDDPSFLRTERVRDRPVPGTRRPQQFVCSGPRIAPETAQRAGGIQWNAATRAAFRQKTLEQLKQIGLADVQERIVSEKMITPADWMSDYSIYRGATFNLAPWPGPDAASPAA